MKNAAIRVLHSALFFVLFTAQLFAQNWQITAPAGSEQTKIDKNGKTVIPNGRYITPRGKQLMTAPHPYGLVLSPDGNVAVTANSGIRPFSITLINNVLSDNPAVKQIPEGVKNDAGILEACFMGLAISPDNKTVYVAGGQSNAVLKYDLLTGKPTGKINCAVKAPSDDPKSRVPHNGYLGDMVMTKDGKRLFVVDQMNFRIVVIDLEKEKVLHNIPTGRYPFGITFSPDEKKVFVANVGVFEYKPFTDLDPKDLKNTAHTYPATKYGSTEMIEGDASKGIPALGEPNVPEAFSVWAYDIIGGQPQVTAKIKTGFLVGQLIEDFPAVGGASPNSLVANDKYVFVSNGNNDCISAIDILTHKVVKNIPLSIDARLGKLRGVIPFGVALSPDKKRLYVAESGVNAVGVIDAETLNVIGHIPTGWFPSKIKVSNDGKKLIVANAKGYGSGPNGGKNFAMTDAGSYIGALMYGSVSVMDIPTDEELKKETAQVVENNFKFIQTDAKTPQKAVYDSLKYIIFIAKENRTYDEVFGQLPNGDGDASLARFGLGVPVSSKKYNIDLPKVDIFRNHIQLAKRFAISDNFYCDSDVSADGHRWLVNTYPNEWCETSTAAAYGGKLSLVDSSQAPGTRAIYGSAGSIYPEDYNEAGSIWDHLGRNNIDFFNFGFGVEMAAAYSDSTMKYIGELYTVNYPLPAPLFDKTSRTFPTYNMAIPDQFRADLFMQEFKKRWSNNNLPPLLTLMLPNDHGTTERPKAGFPFQASYMADNDLAVGRTIEFLSRTPYWKNMLIVITEDDAQGGVDHVDAHRSILQVVSPYAKRNYVGHVHYSFGSIFKTFEDILKIPYLNQYDAGATDLSDLLTQTPDFTPYNALSADAQIFDPAKALTPFDEKFDWKAFSESEELDRTETMQKRRAEDDKEQKMKKKATKKKQNKPKEK
jgi:YVTN family beta-propeller protein